jgi:hypothetical protein
MVSDLKDKIGFTFNGILEKAIIVTVIVLVFVRVLIGRLDYYLLSYPRIPDLAKARTIPYTLKGVTVFITEKDNIQLGWLSWTEFDLLCFLAIMLLLALKWPPPSMKLLRDKEED